MKKGSEIVVKIEKTEFPSIGIGKEGDRKIYVKNSFPGQVVKGRVKKKKADYAEVKMLEVEEKAEYKKTMLPYLIGAVLVFATSNLIAIIYKFGQGLNN